MWSTGSASQSITILTQGDYYNDYTVTVTNSNGCSGTAIITIIETESTFGEETYLGCWGDGYSTVVNGTTYDQSNPTGTETFLNSSNCDSIVNINLIYHLLPTPIVIVTETSGCFDDDGMISTGDAATLGTLDNYSSYNWSTTSTSSSIYTYSQGEYTVTVSDINGCTATASVSISKTDTTNLGCNAYFTYILDSSTNVFTATSAVAGEWFLDGFQAGFGASFSTVLSPGVHDIIHFGQDECGLDCEYIENITAVENQLDSCSLPTFTRAYTKPNLLDTTTLDEFLDVKYSNFHNAYFALGYHNNQVNTSTSFSKLTEEGDIIWSKNIDTYSESIVENYYGNFLLVNIGNSIYNTKIYVLEIDGNNGNILWKREFNNIDLASSIKPEIYENTNGTYTLISNLNYYSSDNDFVIINIGSDGNTLSQKRYDVPANYRITATSRNQYGDFIVFGHVANGSQTFITKINTSGNIVLFKSFSSLSNSFVVNDIEETNDNGYLLLAADNTQGTKEIMAKLDSNLNLQWAKESNIGGTGINSFAIKHNFIYAVYNHAISAYQSHIVKYQMDGTPVNHWTSNYGSRINIENIHGNLIMYGTKQHTPEYIISGRRDALLSVVCDPSEFCQLVEETNISVSEYFIENDTLGITSTSFTATNTLVGYTSSSNTPLLFNPITCQVDSCKYSLGHLEVTCNTIDSTLCIPLNVMDSVPNGIIGMDYCITYDANLMTPTGNAVLNSVVLDGNPNSDFAISTANPGMVCITIYYAN